MKAFLIVQIEIQICIVRTLSCSKPFEFESIEKNMAQRIVTMSTNNIRELNTQSKFMRAHMCYVAVTESPYPVKKVYALVDLCWHFTCLPFSKIPIRDFLFALWLYIKKSSSMARGSVEQIPFFTCLPSNNNNVWRCIGNGNKFQRLCHWNFHKKISWNKKNMWDRNDLQKEFR